MVLADEVSLEHQRLVLVIDHDVVEAGDQLHHEGDLLAVVLQGDVLAHAGAQVLGLAHVDNLAGSVFPQIAAGVGGHLRHLLGDTRHGTARDVHAAPSKRCRFLVQNAPRAPP